MLTLLGFAMVVTFMFLIMTKRLSPVVALIAVPVLSRSWVGSAA
jgi:CitMHS family citrate-Mg2+:H+ or citrate-Ca2+:H+ symporter